MRNFIQITKSCRHCSKPYTRQVPLGTDCNNLLFCSRACYQAARKERRQREIHAVVSLFRDVKTKEQFDQLLAALLEFKAQRSQGNKT